MHSPASLSRSRSTSSVSSMRSSSSGAESNSSIHHHHHHHHHTHRQRSSTIKTGSSSNPTTTTTTNVSQTPPPPPTSSSSSSYNQKLFVCSVCSAKFHVVDQINEHFVASHYQEYQRELSSKSPPRNTNVAQQNEEWRLSDPLNPLKCIKCDFVGRWPTELQKHAASHSTSRPFKCLICSLTYKWRWDLAKHFDRTHPTFRNPYKKRDRDAARNTLVPGGDDLDRSGVSQSGGGRKSRSRSRDEDGGSRSGDDGEEDEDMGVIYTSTRKMAAKNSEIGEASSSLLFMQSRSPSPVPSDDLNHNHSNLDSFQRVI